MVAVRVSTGDAPRELSEAPATLDEAHEVLWRQRPGRDADPLVWVDFHRHSAKVYAQTADIDRRHRHEALQCAGLEIHKARTIEHCLNPDLDGDEA